MIGGNACGFQGVELQGELILGVLFGDGDLALNGYAVAGAAWKCDEVPAPPGHCQIQLQ